MCTEVIFTRYKNESNFREIMVPCMYILCNMTLKPSAAGGHLTSAPIGDRCARLVRRGILRSRARGVSRDSPAAFERQIPFFLALHHPHACFRSKLDSSTSWKSSRTVDLVWYPPSADGLRAFRLNQSIDYLYSRVSF